MDIHGYLWMNHGYSSMDIHGRPWISMEVHFSPVGSGARWGTPFSSALILSVFVVDFRDFCHNFSAGVPRSLVVRGCCLALLHVKHGDSHPDKGPPSLVKSAAVDMVTV